MDKRYNYDWNVDHRGPGVSKQNCNSTCPVKSIIDYFILLHPILLCAISALFSPEQFHEIQKWLSRTQAFHICRLSRD